MCCPKFKMWEKSKVTRQKLNSNKLVLYFKFRFGWMKHSNFENIDLRTLVLWPYLLRDWIGWKEGFFKKSPNSAIQVKFFKKFMMNTCGNVDPEGFWMGTENFYVIPGKIWMNSQVDVHFKCNFNNSWFFWMKTQTC